MSVRGYSRAITATSILGVLVSVYALYIEMALEAKPDYKAYCDISEHMSCSQVLGSKYAKGFGIVKGAAAEIPNCVHGIIFYLLIILLSTFDQPSIVKLQVLVCWLSLGVSVYLAYILYFILYDLCVVCVSTYLVNICNLLLSSAKLRALREQSSGKKSN